MSTSMPQEQNKENHLLPTGVCKDSLTVMPQSNRNATSISGIISSLSASKSMPGSTLHTLRYLMVPSLDLPQGPTPPSTRGPISAFPFATTSSLSVTDIRDMLQDSALVPGHIYSAHGTHTANSTEQLNFQDIAKKASQGSYLSTYASPLSSMSSRRRSDWRSSLSVPRKSSQPASVTVAFAEPERCPPSASAVARLSRKMSMQSIRSKNADKVRDSESCPHLDGEGSVDAQSKEADMNGCANKQQRTEDTPTPEAEGQMTETISKQGRTPWFPVPDKSLEQSSNASNTELVAIESLDTRPSGAEGSILPLNTAAGISSPSTPIPIEHRHRKEKGLKSTPSPSISWFSSLSKGQRDVQSDGRHGPDPHSENNAQHATPQRAICSAPRSPHNSKEETMPSGPPSLGDQDSSGVHSTPLVKLMELNSAQTSEVKPNPSTSTSRFTLSMPLLGRAKAPLDKGITKAGDQTEISASNSISDPTSGSDSDRPTLSRTIERPTSEGPNLPSASSEPSEPIVRSLPENNQASWLDFLGFGSMKSKAASLPVSDPLEEPAPLHTVDGPQSLCPPPPAREQQDNDERHSPIPEERPHSLLSGQNSSATWYSPWGWYEWYRMPSDTSTVPAYDVKTEAEIVKEEALARPDPPISLSGSGSKTGTSSGTPIDGSENPIASSIASDSRGWTTFFSISRALTVKSVRDKEDCAIETMEIDEDAIVETELVAPSGGKVEKDGKLIRKIPPVQPEDRVSNSPKGIAEKFSASSSGVKRAVLEDANTKRGSSPAPSKKSIPPPTPRPPNLVMPSFDDIFNTLPRSRRPPTGSAASTIKKTLGYVSSVLFAWDPENSATEGKGKGRALQADLNNIGKELPRAWSVLGEMPETQLLASCKKVVIIGVHGWFPGFAVRTVLGEPTGTSTKFANMMGSAIDAFAEKYGVKFEQVTKIPLEGEGKIEHRVQKLYRNLTSRDDWMEALHKADVIFVATHSQGCIVSTHLISQLIADGHIRAGRGLDSVTSLAATTSSGGTAVLSGTKKQRVCCLAMCGIHLGPLAYLQKSSLLMPYIQYFESEAAAELFEFQHTESNVSRSYVKALQHVLDNGVKMVYIASLNDQVVPIYSAVFTCISHPLVLRSLYIDGDAYHSSDFLSNLLILLLRIRNAGLFDGGLLTHLSEATAGSLSGVGHSTVYEEPATYSLAVDYLFLVNEGQSTTTEINFEHFDARSALNDYEIPWTLRDLLADDRIVYLFSKEFMDLRDAFSDWHPRTSILRDLKRKLEPIRMLNLTSRL